jgi:uncharacterized protein
MKVVDLNVLLYAVNRDAPQHQGARRWWESSMNGDEQVGLAWPVILGFLRLSTRSGILPRPLTSTQALDTVQDWIEQPLVVLLAPGDGHWTRFRSLIETAGLAGNLTTDAHLAALALEYDATLYSTDADFARFATLRVVNPLEQI